MPRAEFLRAWHALLHSFGPSCSRRFWLIALDAMFAFAVRSPARGQARLAFILAAICAGILLVLPAVFGGRAEQIYRDSVRNLAGANHSLRIESYQRGWFSSRATLSILNGRGAIVFVQHVHHGPFGFYNGWQWAFPVAAVVDTDPQAAVENGLDKVFGEAPLRISTAVWMNDTQDTYISRAATERSDSSNAFKAKFGGFEMKIHSSPKGYTMSGGSPSITAAGAFGEAGLSGIRISGESHREPQSGLWLGGGTLELTSADYSVVGSASRPSASGLIRDIALSARTDLSSGRLEMREGISIGSIAAGGQNLGPIRLAAALNNVPPEPVAQFNRMYRSAVVPGLDPRQQSEEMQRQLYEMIAAVVKGSPAVSLDLHVSSSNGEAVGTAKFQLAPELANDPLFKTGSPDRRSMMSSVWNKYGDATVEIEAPVSVVNQVAKAGQITQLEQNGILVRNGTTYVCRASFKSGEWLVNGRRIQVPTSPPCAKPCTKKS